MGSQNGATPSSASLASAADNNNNNNDEFMQLAVAEAIAGVQRGDGGPFGAVVVKEGQIVARAHNMVLHTNDPTAHAEIVALRLAGKALANFDLSGCTLYTSCYPCPMCLGAVLWSRISNVFYATSATDAASVGFDDAKFYEYIQQQVGSYSEMLSLKQLRVREQMVPFQKWAEKEDKRMY